MRLYKEYKKHKYASGETKYIYGKKVEEGQLVKLHRISGTFENVATTEYIELGVYDGAKHIEIAKKQPDGVGYLVHESGTYYMGEGDQVYVYCADVADGEEITLIANGVYLMH